MHNENSLNKAIRKIAMREGVTVEEVRKQMRLAILEGLSNKDPGVRKQWKNIPCEGEIPTPEELIDYIVARVDSDSDLYWH